MTMFYSMQSFFLPIALKLPCQFKLFESALNHSAVGQDDDKVETGKLETVAIIKSPGDNSTRCLPSKDALKSEIKSTYFKIKYPCGTSRVWGYNKSNFHGFRNNERPKGKTMGTNCCN
jgi:hypothetical protein